MILCQVTLLLQNQGYLNSDVSCQKEKHEKLEKVCESRLKASKTD